MIVEVAPVRYRPHDDGYRLDIEVLEAEELRRRVASNPQRGFERVDFQCLLFVQSGEYSHTIDFETFRCTAGSCLLITPGQVHCFGSAADWDGWILIVSPHHVPDEVGRLPPHVRTPEGTAAAIAELFARMIDDASSAADPQTRNELLALQSELLVTRLLSCHAGQGQAQPVDQIAVNRYREYRAAVDEHHRRWHLVTPYARHLGCSTKSLNRACRTTGDVTAKRVIVERIILEAKRLLAQSSHPAAKISTDLGFDEATNFVKFFKRETGLTPTQFRAGILTTD